ncbi:MAG: carbohydrate kinase family protein [Solobacterium sp.]|nr:carbohydrate kinase family protein [Solobacterium sp.]
MNRTITGIGAACMDYLNVVEDYPAEDGSTHILSQMMQGGGACATAVAAAQRLGHRGRMIANVGTDETGRQIIDSLKQEGVDVSCVRCTEGMSPSSQIMVNPRTGSRTKFVQNNVLDPVEWDRACIDMIRTSDVIHLDGTRYDNAMAAAETAKKYHIPVSLDGCHMEADKSLSRKLAAQADILIMNRRYPMMVSEKENLEEALAYFAENSKIVITTLGRDGCIAYIDGRMEHFDAYEVDAVDSTGAGDVFHGAFLAAWLNGQDIRSCIRYASACAALKCTKPGGRTGIPSHTQLMKFILERES